MHATALLRGVLHLLRSRGAESLWGGQGRKVKATGRGTGKCQGHFL